MMATIWEDPETRKSLIRLTDEHDITAAQSLASRYSKISMNIWQWYHPRDRKREHPVNLIGPFPDRVTLKAITELKDKINEISLVPRKEAVRVALAEFNAKQSKES